MFVRCKLTQIYFVLFVGIVFVVGVLVYTIKGFQDNFSPGSSFYVAWITCGMQLLTSLMWFYSYVKVGKLTKLQVYEAGLTA